MNKVKICFAKAGKRFALESRIKAKIEVLHGCEEIMEKEYKR